MEKIFYADKSTFTSSDEAVRKILSEYFDIENAVIYRNENGKPYLENKNGLFFSVSHTKQKIFLAFADENVGIDAELFARHINLNALLRKFPAEERSEISCTGDYLRHWTIKESAIKWLGGTIAHDLCRLSFIKNQLCYNGIDIPVFVTSLTIAEHTVSVCSERNFKDAELICL